MKLAYALIATAALASSSVIAQSRHVPVQDPAELAAAGFAPDAANVWRLLDTEPARNSRPLDPEGGAPTVDTSTTVTAEDFQQKASNGQYQAMSYAQLQCDTGSPYFNANLRLPSGKRLEYLDVWGRNTSAFPIRTTMFSACKADDTPGTTINTIIGQYTSAAPGTGGYSTWVTLPDGVFTDTEHCAYEITISFGDPATFTCQGSTQVFYKARVVWDSD